MRKEIVTSKFWKISSVQGNNLKFENCSFKEAIKRNGVHLLGSKRKETVSVEVAVPFNCSIVTGWDLVGPTRKKLVREIGMKINVDTKFYIISFYPIVYLDFHC